MFSETWFFEFEHLHDKMNVGMDGLFYEIKDLKKSFYEACHPVLYTCDVKPSYITLCYVILK